MLNETQILFNKIKDFRKKTLITEGVSNSDIRKYMEKHQFVYIFYAGDGSNPRGWRTIRPYVLGTMKSGDTTVNVVRAWQDKGRSADFMNRPTRPDSQNHDFWVDDDGKTKPGWRMFRLDRIESMYPTGKRFVDDNGNVVIPPKYNESGDKDMLSITFQITRRKAPEIEPDVDEPTKPLIDTRKDWSVFDGVDATTVEIKRDELINLKRIASNVMKKKAGSFFVALNNKGEFEIVEEKNRDKVNEKAILGNLQNLFHKIVGTERIDKSFIEKQRSETLNETNEEKKGGFPYNIRSFFKN